MQLLADALKVDRKALHYHVRDRQSLFELVARDAFLQRLSQCNLSDSSSWREACRIYARSLAASAAALAELVDYLWFSHVMANLSLEPVESLFTHLDKAGFPDAEAVRLVTVLPNVCLGHARDLAQARKEGTRTRPRLLKSALDAKKQRPEYSCLERISSLKVNTYGPEQLDFSIELILDGADAALARLASSRCGEHKSDTRTSSLLVWTKRHNLPWHHGVCGLRRMNSGVTYTAQCTSTKTHRLSACRKATLIPRSSSFERFSRTSRCSCRQRSALLAPIRSPWDTINPRPINSVNRSTSTDSIHWLDGTHRK